MFSCDSLRSHIHNKGIKQKKIAEGINISETRLCQILLGKAGCDVDIYVKICNFLDVPFELFINQDQETA